MATTFKLGDRQFLRDDPTATPGTNSTMERQPQQQQHPSLARRPKLGLAAILPPGAVAPKRPRAGGCGACDDWTIAVPTRNEAASGNRRREGAFAKATIGGTEPMEMTCQAIKDGPQLGASRCPCCDRTLGVAGRQVVGETDVKSRCVDSLLTCSSSDSDDTGDDTEESSRTVPGYVVKEVIAQGHVHKKGSGCDWLGSRAWKDRWAVLVVRSVMGARVVQNPVHNKSLRSDRSPSFRCPFPVDAASQN